MRRAAIVAIAIVSLAGCSAHAPSVYQDRDIKKNEIVMLEGKILDYRKELGLPPRPAPWLIQQAHRQGTPPPVTLPPPSALAFEPLPRIRLAEPFEALRDASDRVRGRTGARPEIFLANLGTPADFTARATFARNFFAAGGIEAAGNDGFATRDAMIEAFKASGAKLACLCSSD